MNELTPPLDLVGRVYESAANAGLLKRCTWLRNPPDMPLVHFVGLRVPDDSVVLTNQRDLHLYDIPRDRTTPRHAIALDDLPKYSDAFPFFSTTWVPGALPQIVDVSKVSG